MAGNKGALNQVRSSRASYMRDYRKTSGKVIRYREFRRGVEAMRDAAQKLLRGTIGEGMVDGYTAANLLTTLNPQSSEEVISLASFPSP